MKRQDEQPIFQIIRNLIPSLNNIGDQLVSEHETTKRHHKLLLIMMSSLISLVELLDTATSQTESVSLAIDKLSASHELSLRNLSELDMYGNESPIVLRLKGIIPPVGQVIVDLEKDREIFEETQSLVLLILAGMLEMSEVIDKFHKSGLDLGHAMGDLETHQVSHMHSMEDAASKSAGAATVAQNLWVWVLGDASTVKFLILNANENVIQETGLFDDLPAERRELWINALSKKAKG